MASVLFAGATTYLGATSNLFSDPVGYTVMGWSKFTDPEADRHLWSTYSAGGPTHKIIWLNSVNQLYFTADDASNWAVPASQPTVTTWFCWAMTVNGAGASNMTAYLRADGGGSWSTATSTVVSYTPTALYIGTPAASIPGYFRYVRMWNAVLSEADLSLEFACNVPVRTANLLRDMRLAGSAAATTDSANGYDMTLNSTLGADGDDPTSPVSPSGSGRRLMLLGVG